MSKIEVVRERLTVASADGKISDDVLGAVANMLESRWPGQFACNAMSEPALLAALLEDAGASKHIPRQHGEWAVIEVPKNLDGKIVYVLPIQEEEPPGSAEQLYGCAECGIESCGSKGDWIRHEREIHSRERRVFA